MPMPTSGTSQYAEVDNLNIKLLYATKQNSADDPVQIAFAVTDEQGVEQILTAELPFSNELFKICLEHGWISQRSRVTSFQRGRRAA